jgi:hypothetical protein
MHGKLGWLASLLRAARFSCVDYERLGWLARETNKGGKQGLLASSLG